ncbi:hypothetical protein [Streptomyces mirabilis]|uniref:hypothetical protein n=1 Tax=Streptomyces mirabilis TaxID=68239 RepID=UPI0033DBFC23
MLEYLWRAAWCLHDTGDASAEAWVARHARTLLAGGVQQTAASLKAAARAARLRGTKRKGIDDAVNYRTSKAEHLRFAASGPRLSPGKSPGCRRPRPARAYPPSRPADENFPAWSWTSTPC